jgi:DNA-binding NtrC family response regulator
MSQSNFLPRILIVDDLFGRTHHDRRNEERANLCGQYLLKDVTGDEAAPGDGQKIKNPVAQAVFWRGQTPACADVGDEVRNDLEGTLKVIEEGWERPVPGRQRWSLLLLDLSFYQGRVTVGDGRSPRGMPKGLDGDDDPQSYFGITILEAVQSRFPDLPVIILSSKDRKEVSRRFTKYNALGFLPRDEGSPARLREYIQRYGLIPDDRGLIVGHSKELLVALRAARDAARLRQNILIRGEEGTGKELIAEYIHRHSEDPTTPYVVVNCAMHSEELFVADLFGHSKGGFTGATEARRGLIVDAHGGDLFFDEVGDMLPRVQAGVLRVLQDGHVPPGMGRQTRRVDVRFISATNKDIEAAAAKGAFRSDLLNRLRSGDTIYLVPLRDRKEDVRPLVEKFVRAVEQEAGALTREIEPEVFDACMDYDWPGNIRQLQTCIRRAVRRHADVEHMLADHLIFDDDPSSATPHPSTAQTFVAPSPVPQAPLPSHPARTPEELAKLIEGFDFGPLEYGELEGRLELLKGACARLLARYLLAALELTKKRSSEHPDGEVLYHPAMKMMLGDEGVKATPAADEVKRLLKFSREDVKELLETTLLGEALERAESTRPSKKKQAEPEPSVP